MPTSQMAHRDLLKDSGVLTCGAFTLYALGEMICDAEYRSDEPATNGITVFLTTSGKARIIAGSEAASASESEAILIAPGTGYTVTVDAGTPVRCFYISLAPTGDKSYRASADGWFAASSLLRAVGNFDAHSLHFRLVRELRQRDVYSARVIELTLEQLWITLIRALAHDAGRDTEGAVRDDGGIVDRIIALIDANCGTMRNLADISQKLGYSYPYLSHVFSKHMGKSIKEFYQQILFERAVEMLKADVSITQISERLGYQAIHSFSRAFSNYYGVSPSRYLSTLRQSAPPPSSKEGGRDE